MSRRTPRGFFRVIPTPEEIQAYRDREEQHRMPANYRVQCVACGTRIWGSGLGIGSHRRACRGERAS